MWAHRDLILSLARRQYQLRYRQSLVGVAWAFLMPLVTLGAAILVFDKVARIETGKIPYTVFALSALAPWTFFASSVSFGVPSVAGAQGMLNRLVFPRIALPLSMIGTAFLDLAVSVFIFLVFVFATGTSLPITALWFPVILLVEVVLAVGVVLLGSALNVFARDIRLAVPLFVQMWLFVTPVMYPLSQVPENLHGWYALNPMTGIVRSFRMTLARGLPPEVETLLPAAIFSVAIFVLGSWYFAATENRFADVI